MTIFNSPSRPARSIGRAIVLVSLSACLAACDTDGPALSETISQSSQVDRAAILANGERWIALYESGEIEAMRDLYEDDALVMPQGAPLLRGRDEIITFFARNQQAGNQTTFRSETEDLVIENNRAYLVTQFWMQIRSPDGERTEHRGRTLLVYRKGDDGAWRVWRDMDNSAPDVDLGPVGS